MSESSEIEHGESYDIAMDRGEWEVGDSENGMFGESLTHGLGGPVVFIGLPRLGGWQPFGHVHMSHQTYKAKVEEWLEQFSSAREVAVLDFHSGEKVTVWAADRHEPMFPKGGKE